MIFGEEIGVIGVIESVPMRSELCLAVGEFRNECRNSNCPTEGRCEISLMS